MSKYEKEVKCDSNLSFQECELAILRASVDLADSKRGKKVVNSPEVQKMIKILESFLRKKKLVCYGGSAINAILPEEDKFYNKDIEIPDYDFYSPNAIENSKELADIYYNAGYKTVEAKSGSHHGTYKVFVNFIAIADISFMPKDLYNSIKKDAINIDGILFAPPNFLRMASYLELSRPMGQTDRWEKVLKRLSLLNKHYPLYDSHCYHLNYQRKMENTEDEYNEYKIYEIVKNTFIEQECVFFGSYAIANYSTYMPKHEKYIVRKYADFDVLSNDPETTCDIVKERLDNAGIENVKIKKREPIGELVPEQYEISVGDDIIGVVYKPVGCHSFNTIKLNGKKVRIATIDTMLAFYLAFIYADKPYYDPHRIYCMAKFLFEVQQKNRLRQKGLLRRFTITCYGHQPSVEELKAEKAEKYKELRNKKDEDEYKEWFFNYKPGDITLDEETIEEFKQYKKKTKTKTKTKKIKTKKIKTQKKTKKTKTKTKKFKIHRK